MSSIQLQEKEVIQSRLLDLIKNENKYCADCGNELIPSSIWVSLSFHVFLCLQCGGIHRNLGNEISRIKSLLLDQWTMEECEIIMKHGNLKVNEIYEKYGVPKKPFPTEGEDALLLRQKFIKDKYIDKKFMKPKDDEIKESQQQTPQSSPLRKFRTRLVNSFIVVGRGTMMKKQKPLDEIEDPTKIYFNPTILDSYTDEGGITVPTHAAQFAFPDGLTLSAVDIEPSIFSFVLTDVSGTKIYAVVLKFYEEFLPLEMASLFLNPDDHESSPPKDKQTQQDVKRKSTVPKWAMSFLSERDNGKPSTFYCPKCIMILSCYPFLKTFGQFLKYIYRLSLSTLPIPLERYIINLVSEIPLPPKGKIQVQINLEESVLYITRPPKNELPLSDFSFRLLFRVLDVKNILILFTYLLLEQKTVLCSSKIGILTPIIETLLSLMFPFCWQGVYIPVLPITLLDVLDAPVPFLVGLHSSYLASNARRPNEVIFVDLDHNRIIYPTGENEQPSTIPKLPTKWANKLRLKLAAASKIFDPLSPEIGKVDLAFKNEEHRTAMKADCHDSAGVTVTMRRTEKFQSPPNKSTQRKGSFAFSTGLKTSASFASLDTASAGSPISSKTSNDEEWMEECSDFHKVEIRKAFLQFFVSLLKNYETFLQPFREKKDPLFNTTDFLKENSDQSWKLFMTCFLGSQIFQKFCEEKVYNSAVPEIMYFDAAVKLKLSRLHTFGKRKSSNSYIDDKTDEFREIFVSPPPSSSGLPEGQPTRYQYRRFPKFKSHLFGIPRRPRELSTSIDEGRRISCIDVHQQIYSLTALSRTPQTWSNTVKAITKVQATYRCRQCCRAYNTKRIAIVTIQRWFRSHRIKEDFRVQVSLKVKQVVKIQSLWRRKQCMKRYKAMRAAIPKIQSAIQRYLHRKAYLKARSRIIRVQALWRGRRCRQKYKRIRRLVLGVQSHFRGNVSRRQLQRVLEAAVSARRKTVFDLWKANDTSLLYRAWFWTLCQEVTLINLAMYRNEELRLSNGNQQAKEPQIKFNIKERLRYRFTFLKTQKPNSHCVAALESEIQDLSFQEQKEVYLALKRIDSTKKFSEYCEEFGIPLKSSNRKRQLVSLLWQDYEKADNSAKLLLAIDGDNTSMKALLLTRQKEWINKIHYLSFNALFQMLQRSEWRLNNTVEKRIKETICPRGN